jgi:hypothetical protein
VKTDLVASLKTGHAVKNLIQLFQNTRIISALITIPVISLSLAPKVFMIYDSM